MILIHPLFGLNEYRYRNQTRRHVSNKIDKFQSIQGQGHLGGEIVHISPKLPNSQQIIKITHCILNDPFHLQWTGMKQMSRLSITK